MFDIDNMQVLLLVESVGTKTKYVFMLLKTFFIITTRYAKVFVSPCLLQTC